MHIGRYAPSPTGPLHVGNGFTAYIAFKRAERFLMRIEDLDTQRAIDGMAAQHLDDLRRLGIRWDGEPVVQTTRMPVYERAVQQLLDAGLAYYCTCSRKQLQQSAPHGLQDDPPPYPGTCRHRTTKPNERYSVRFRVRPGDVGFTDGFKGPFTQNVERDVGDFIIARADGMYAYQLAVVVDDIAMGITEVVRGGDLIASTPRQLLLYEAFNAKPPAFAHTPLITAGNEKLSKRNPQHLLRAHPPEQLRAWFDSIDLSTASQPIALR